MIGAGNPANFVIGEIAMGPIHHVADFACVNEKRLASPITEFSVGLIPSQKPETRGNLCAIEKLAGQGNHAIYEVGLDDGLTNLALS